jgi:pimeloyl-ACP methyl ester carboxylesterase
MHYETQGDGPPVALLHSLGSCSEDWFLQLPPLSRRYTVLTLDALGHGQTAKPPGPYSIRRMAGDVAALLEALNVEPAHVVGLSMGGLIAQVLAARYPQRVRSLVLVNTFAHLRPRSLHTWWYVLSRGVTLLHKDLSAHAEVVAREMFPDPRQEPLRQVAVMRLCGNDPTGYRAALLATIRFDGRRDLARIAAPTLVIAGDQDTTVDRRAQEQLTAGIRSARLVVVPDSGHLTPIDQADVFNQLVLDFLPRG